MKMTLDTVSWTVTQPLAAGLAGTVVAGDSAQVRSTGAIIGGDLIGLWTNAQLAGFTQVLFPYGHDMSRNIRYTTTAAAPNNQIPLMAHQPMKSQDLMTILQGGSVTAGDVETVHALIAYPELEGGSDKYIGTEELRARVEELVTINDTVTATAASVYSGARALNAVTTTLKANRNYAILGGQVGIVGGCLSIRGQDTANLRASMPCNPLNPAQTINWFADLAYWKDMPLIPVINAANQANTFIELVQNENLVAVPFSLTLALLAE
jgi:antitoxin component of RelBE/YafQ-DinJ toxin-antitoxin module